MRRYSSFIIPVAILGVLGSFLYKPYHRWAREHVNYITALMTIRLDAHHATFI